MLVECSLNISFFINMSGNLKMQMYLLTRSSILMPKQQAWGAARGIGLGHALLGETTWRLNDPRMHCLPHCWVGPDDISEAELLILTSGLIKLYDNTVQ